MTAELRRIAAALRRREKAEKDLRDAIVEALAARTSVQAIADVLGVTRQRVWQIRKDAE